MSALSSRQKAVLIALSLIMAALAGQMFFRVGVFGFNQGVAATEEEISIRYNLLHEPGVSLSVSSFLGDDQHHAGPARLTDGNRSSIWHVAHGRIRSSNWVKVDFGEGRERTVRAAAALPRQDLPDQFFRRAVLHGSRDGASWELIGELRLRAPPMDGGWRLWSFNNTRSYRYYRLTINAGWPYFHSMAQLALFS